jgi:hypothetical protein
MIVCGRLHEKQPQTRLSLWLHEPVVASCRPLAEARVFTSYFNKEHTAFLVIDGRRDFCDPKGFLAVRRNTFHNVQNCFGWASVSGVLLGSWTSGKIDHPGMPGKRAGT